LLTNYYTIKSVEKNILKNLKYNNILHIVASDEQSKRKAIQVGLKVLFRLRNKQDNNYILKVAKIEELERSKYEHWDEIRL
jgi:hypothetical protein